MGPIRITDERAYTRKEMTKIRMEFQQTDFDTETQRLLHLQSKKGHNLILTGAETVKLKHITTDAKFNEHLRALRKKHINIQRSLTGQQQPGD